MTFGIILSSAKGLEALMRNLAIVKKDIEFG
jgi:hypothetical protein